MPKYAEGDNVRSPYLRGGRGVVVRWSHTEPPWVHGVTGTPQPASDWYFVKDADGQHLIDDTRIIGRTGANR
jgi:hypothetical protein